MAEKQLKLGLGGGRTVTVSWVARQLGVSEQTVRNYIEEGRLDAYRLGGNTSPWRVLYESYVALIAKCADASARPGQ